MVEAVFVILVVLEVVEYLVRCRHPGTYGSTDAARGFPRCLAVCCRGRSRRGARSRGVADRAISCAACLLLALRAISCSEGGVRLVIMRSRSKSGSTYSSRDLRSVRAAYT